MLKVYYGNIQNLESEWEAYALNRERAERIRRYKKKLDQARSVGAELLLNQALIQIFPDFVPPAVFQKGEHGKPALAEENKSLRLPSGKLVEFNLSHSGDFAACVVADRPVGIDIERERETLSPGILRFLAGPERKAIEEAGCSPSCIVNCWVLKESYMKAVGTGFAKSPASFCLADEREGFRVYENGMDQGYGLRILPAPPGYRMAVCAKDGIWENIEPEEVFLGPG